MVRSLGSEEEALGLNADVLLEWLPNQVTPWHDGRDLWIKGLQRLEFPALTIGTEFLEDFLNGCPVLDTLRCTLDCTGLTLDDRAEYRQTLRRLMEQHGSRLKELDVRCKGGSIITYLIDLVGPHTLRLTGAVAPIDEIVYSEGVWWTTKAHENTTRRLIIEPNRDTETQLINPYEAARIVRHRTSRSCVIRVEDPPKLKDRLLGEKKGWVEQFRSIFKTLEREGIINWKGRNRTGWKKLENAPQDGGITVAGGDHVKSPSVDGDVKSASVGGKMEDASGDDNEKGKLDRSIE